MHEGSVAFMVLWLMLGPALRYVKRRHFTYFTTVQYLANESLILVEVVIFRHDVDFDCSWL